MRTAFYVTQRVWIEASSLKKTIFIAQKYFEEIITFGCLLP